MWLCSSLRGLCNHPFLTPIPLFFAATSKTFILRHTHTGVQVPPIALAQHVDSKPSTTWPTPLKFSPNLQK